MDRIVVLTRNPIATAMETIAGLTGREVVVVEQDADERGLAEVRRLGLRAGDAVVLCDHDAPDAPGLEKLHVPAGLNTGGQAPGEIALSVVAEIVAESNGRHGGPMRGDL